MSEEEREKVINGSELRKVGIDNFAVIFLLVFFCFLFSGKSKKKRKSEASVCVCRRLVGGRGRAAIYLPVGKNHWLS